LLRALDKQINHDRSERRFQMRTGILLLLLATVFTMLCGFPTPQAEAVTLANVTGEIDRLTLDPPADFWAGGTITVGGQNVIIPKNLLLDLPANRLTLRQLFDQAPAACRLVGETGLAKADTCNTAGTRGFATISANRSDAGNIIAGDVFIEKGRETVNGQVTYIDYNDGYFVLNGLPGDPNTGVMVRLNDPDSRHTVQQGRGCIAGSPNCSPDPRFLLDPDNYTNVFISGYPLCIPSTVSRPFPGLPAVPGVPALPAGAAQSDAAGAGDVLCPDTNRSATPAPDSRRFAPIMIGDSITAEGNFETVGTARFLSAHTTKVGVSLLTRNDPSQPDYLFLEEVEVDAPAYQNDRVRALFIGFTTLQPSDVLLWSVHYDRTGRPNELPLASVVGCERAGGVGSCANQGLPGGAVPNNIFKIRYDVDFRVPLTKAELNPCSVLGAELRFNFTHPLCPRGPASLADQFGILVPISHEIQARTGHSLANPGLITLDISGNQATNGQYLFPLGMNLGGIAVPEMVEINLNRVNTPTIFDGITWNLDRRLGPGGCSDPVNGCGAGPFALDPFPFSALDPRIQSPVAPAGAYIDRNFTASDLSNVMNRIFSFVDSNIGKFNGNATLLSWPPPAPPALPVLPTQPVPLVCGVFGNIPPIAVDDFVTITAGTPSATMNLTANDLDFDGAVNPASLIVSQPAPGSGSVLNLGNGSVIYTPPSPVFTGTVTFTYTVNDSAIPPLTSNVATVTVVIVPGQANLPPQIISTPVTTAVVAQPYSYDVNATDPNGDLLTYSLVTAPAGMTISPATGLISWTPGAGQVGPNSVTARVQDPGGLFADQSFTVTVNPANAPPAITSTPVTSAVVGLPYSYDVNATDPNGDTLAYSLVAAPAGMTINSTTGLINWTPTAAQAGPNNVTARAQDPGGLFADQSFTVTVTQPDTIAVTKAQFTLSTNTWLVEGTSLPAPAQPRTVTVYLGPTVGGTFVGTTTVAADGKWIFIQPNSPVRPPSTLNQKVSVSSSGGGKIENVTLLIVR
jgi:hypothetical protein